jgi:hypothetical protein
MKLILRVRGHVEIGNYTNYNSRNLVNVYAGKCRTHGTYIDQVHTGARELRCPECEKEFLNERTLLSWQEENV